MEELADYLQRFACANLIQQEVDVYLDNVEAGAMKERMAQALDMEPGRACIKDRTTPTHTAKGMQTSVMAVCADLFGQRLGHLVTAVSGEQRHRQGAQHRRAYPTLGRWAGRPVPPCHGGGGSGVGHCPQDHCQRCAAAPGQLSVLHQQRHVPVSALNWDNTFV